MHKLPCCVLAYYRNGDEENVKPQVNVRTRELYESDAAFAPVVGPVKLVVAVLLKRSNVNLFVGCSLTPLVVSKVVIHVVK